MKVVFRTWIDKYFSNEEALLLVIMLAASWLILFTMGSIIAPVIAGIIIAFLLQGIVDRVKRIGAPHFVAVLVAFTFLISMLAAFILLLLPIIWEQLIKFVGELPSMFHQLQAALYLLPEKYPNFITVQQLNDLVDLSSEHVIQIEQKLLTVSMGSFSVISHIFVYLILVPILVFLFLKDGSLILNWLSDFLPTRRPMLSSIWEEMIQQAANYVRGKVIQILIVIVVCYSLFKFLGLNYAMLLAIVVGISVLIPYLGTSASSIPVFAVGFFQWGLSPDFIVLCVSFALIHAIDGNILVPLIFSETVNLHPVAIILAVLVFGGLWGFWGVFFAIPLATLVKAIINSWPSASELNG